MKSRRTFIKTAAAVAALSLSISSAIAAQADTIKAAAASKGT